jgi:1,4-dihydroxy-2-naphthoyl-CoA hydrolase
MIWKRKPDIDAINGMLEETLSSALGMSVSAIGDNYLEGRMPVDSRTIQPFGVMHGGASAALAETLGSFASHLMLDPDLQFGVGVDLNITHLRAVRSGYVVGRAEAIQIGSTIHVWRIDIRDADGRPVSAARLTVLIRDQTRV